MRVWLRRQASSRKLQRMWRAFADRQTTRQLAENFIKTGITSLPVEQLPKADTAVQTAQSDVPADPPASTPSASPTKGGQPSGPAIAWVGANTHVTNGADLPPQEQSQDAFEEFAKAIQSPATLKSAKVCFLTSLCMILLSECRVNFQTVPMSLCCCTWGRAGRPLLLCTVIF